MEIVVLITAFEMAALMTWMIYKHYSRNKQMMPQLMYKKWSQERRGE